MTAVRFTVAMIALVTAGVVLILLAFAGSSSSSPGPAASTRTDLVGCRAIVGFTAEGRYADARGRITRYERDVSAGGYVLELDGHIGEPGSGRVRLWSRDGFFIGDVRCRR